MNIESAIQRALVSWIKEIYPAVKIAASQNENSRHATQMGTDIGEPDIRLLLRVDKITYSHYLELKKKKGKLQPNQIKWNLDFDENCKSLNCTRSVGYGFIEAKQQVIEWIASILSQENKNL